jgi:GNAT superfamily N-acetyltransferase
MAVEIRLLQNHELQLANNFFNRIYKTDRSIENFTWEFINGPKGKAIYIVAIDTAIQTHTEIVGIQCAIPLELMDARGNAVLTAKSEDTLVDPKYRGQKIFERMYDTLFEQCRKSGIYYIWGFTPALKAFERIGFQAPFKTQQGIMVFKPLKAYTFLKNLNTSNTFFSKLKILGLSFASLLIGTKRIFVPSSQYVMRQVQFDSKESIVKDFYAGKENYFIKQDLRYQEWRLIENPFKNNYINYQFSDATDKIVADILINIRQRVSYIEQVYIHSDLKPSVARQFLKQIIGDLRQANAPLIRTLNFDTNLELSTQIELLKSVGFIILKRGNFFVWKSLDAADRIDPKKLFLTRLFTQGNL